jgi:hypothetical protein
MNNGREILIFHSPILMTIQAIEGEITHWSNFSVCINKIKIQNKIRNI